MPPYMPPRHSLDSGTGESKLDTTFMQLFKTNSIQHIPTITTIIFSI